MKDVLNHYFEILKGKELPFFKKISLIPARRPDELVDIWCEHERIGKREISGNRVGSQAPKSTNYIHTDSLDSKTLFSQLDLNIVVAERLYNKCIFCQRRCEINRYQETGVCGLPG